IAVPPRAIDGGPPTLPRPGPISFLSDYGLDDEFVGVVHRVIAGIDPSIPVIDLLHNIARHDVPTAAKALWRSAPWLAPGVLRGIVAPGVAGGRGAVVVCAREANASLVGPDNGRLLPAAPRLGEITDATALAHPPGLGATFAGRDIFAPAAAQIASGVDP